MERRKPRASREIQRGAAQAEPLKQGRLTLKEGSSKTVSTKALRDRQLALAELVHAIRHYRKIADSKPLTLQGSDYAARRSGVEQGYRPG
jgi:hypothetical protein